MAFLLSLERTHRVVRATAAEVIGTQDLLDLDIGLIAFLAREETFAQPVRRSGTGRNFKSPEHMSGDIVAAPKLRERLELIAAVITRHSGVDFNPPQSELSQNCFDRVIST
jgi:hypothetical protein